jgi:hypothetical protein
MYSRSKELPLESHLLAENPSKTADHECLMPWQGSSRKTA